MLTLIYLGAFTWLHRAHRDDTEENNPCNYLKAESEEVSVCRTACQQECDQQASNV